MWDHRAKKRIKVFPRRPTDINAIAFSDDGTRLAVAASSVNLSDKDQRKELGMRETDPDHRSISIWTTGADYKV